MGGEGLKEGCSCCQISTWARKSNCKSLCVPLLGPNPVTSSSIYFSVSRRDWLHKLLLWLEAYEFPCCCFTGVHHRTHIHSCLKLTLLSYQKWLHSFPDINTLLKVLYCKFFVLPDSALSRCPQPVTTTNCLSEEAAVSQTHIKIPDAQHLWKVGPDWSRRIRFYSLGYWNILFWILNVGLATTSQSIQHVTRIYGNS